MRAILRRRRPTTPTRLRERAEEQRRRYEEQRREKEKGTDKPEADA